MPGIHAGRRLWDQPADDQAVVAAAALSAIVDHIETEHERVVLTRNGRPAAVLLSPEDLEVLEETLELLSDPDALREIRQARAEIDRGDVLTGEHLRQKYLGR
ncbi:MAG: type II toxin-antitoxin system Phd/YefM family antitoxin [Egibacteraceae bacterium]